MTLPIKLRGAALGEFEPGDQITMDLIAGLMGRNRLINGDFSMWQRATSSSAAASRRYVADRWEVWSTGTTTAVDLLTGYADRSPSGNVQRIVVASSAGANNFALTRQRIENVYTLANGKATLSLWLYSLNAATIGVNIEQYFGTGGSSAVLGAPQTVTLAASTWTYVVLTFDIPSVAGKTIGAGSSIDLNFWWDTGSANASRSGIGQQSGTYFMGSVQLENGAVATPFDVRPLEVEIALSQRFYEKSYDIDTAPGSIGTIGAVVIYGSNFNSAAHGAGTTVQFKVTKRAVPSIVSYSTTSGTAARVRDAGNNADLNNSTSNIGTTGFFNSATQGTASTTINMQFHWAADAEL